MVKTESYKATCSNPKKSNKPNYTIDERGNRTDYTYNATNGEVTRIQVPAATSGGTRPEIRYAYTQYYAQIRNSSGTLVNTGDPFYRVTQITTCATAATCAGTAHETKVTLAYNNPNRNPSSVTPASGNGSISSTDGSTHQALGAHAKAEGPM